MLEKIVVESILMRGIWRVLVELLLLSLLMFRPVGTRGKTLTMSYILYILPRGQFTRLY